MSWRIVLRIAMHEWHLLRSDKALWLALALLTASVGYGIANGMRWVTFERATIERAFEEQSQRYDALKRQVIAIESGREQAPFADPRKPDMAGGRLAWTYAAMRPLTLAPLSIGQSDVLPYYYKISTASKESVLALNEIENPHRLLHGRFDLSFVVIYVFPLLIIALSYDTVSLEKEQGTLALLLSQPVSLMTAMIGKIAVRAALIMGLVMLLSVVGIAVAGVGVSGDALIRLGMWIAIVAMYGAFWFAVVLLVTSFGLGSATNALSLAAIWLLLVVVLPSTLNMAVSVLYPMPSRVDMIAALRVATDEASAKGNRLLAKYYGDHPELASGADLENAMNDVAVTRLAMDDDIEQRVRPVVDRYDIQRGRQQAAIDRFRLLSPAIIAQDALNDVAGTGAARYRHFTALVDDYHRDWRARFASLVVAKRTFTADMYDALPPFGFHEEPLRDVASRGAASLIALAAASALAAGIGAVKLRAYPVAG